MFKTLFDRFYPPGFIFNWRLAFRFHTFREIDQPFSRVVASIQKHVFNALAQLRLDLFVNRELSGVDNSHVEPGADRVKKERGVHRFAHGVVAAKRKRNVAHAAAHPRTRKICFDPSRGLDEIDRVMTMLFETGRHR